MDKPIYLHLPAKCNHLTSQRHYFKGFRSVSSAFSSCVVYTFSHVIVTTANSDYQGFYICHLRAYAGPTRILQPPLVLYKESFMEYSNTDG